MNNIGHKPIVAITGGSGAYENTRSALAALDLSRVTGKKVLIKPNAGRIAPPESGITTSADAVGACADAILEAGAGVVAVGESPIQGVNALEALEVSGIAGAARKRDLELIDLDEEDPTTVKFPEGSLVDELKVCGRVEKFDLVVSVPVMKTHMHTGVSLSLKNIKGTLHGREKVKLHQLSGQESGGIKPLDTAIVDILSLLMPDLAVIDGSVGLEGLGPSAGTPKRLDAAVASWDAVAADAAACRLMGIDPLTVPHIRLAGERGLGVADPEAIEFVPDDYEKFVSPFERPPEDLALVFPDVVIYEAGACSACVSTAMLFLQRFAGEITDYRLEDGKLHIALGKDVEDVPAGTVVIGNCAAKHAGKGPFAKGCPPVASRIYRAITGKEPKEPVP